ncbi:prephenate dehydrogenase/arogenate dehydrogenase family protein [Marinitoga aeolica]|uniref:Prephenate dehydrogenase n=1 Tax=Marinitoga aeolica TaxID=2809031 RepID=A0ABY8PPL0_9BACT|nr:prephenate dehydrogenase/arogenate dehydrogenase family protein [Marinitoga aeolica]WGS64561.1 prephenate dehydrogenase [Marinitoga aeolica]
MLENKRLLIIGHGRMGKWFAKELSKINNIEIMVYDIKNQDFQKSRNYVITNDLKKVSEFNPSFILNCAPLSNTIDAFENIVENINNKKNIVFGDIASIKNDVKKFYQLHNLKYVSFHPMFGPTFANMGNLKGENVIFISGSENNYLEFFKSFFTKYNLKIHTLSFDEHDKMMAYSLSVPFISSLVFAGRVDKTIVPGTTFAKHLSIAKGVLMEDTNLISEILFNSLTVEEIGRINSNLEYLKHIIMTKDKEELEKFLSKLRNNVL